MNSVAIPMAPLADTKIPSIAFSSPTVITPPSAITNKHKSILINVSIILPLSYLYNNYLLLYDIHYYLNHSKSKVFRLS